MMHRFQTDSEAEGQRIDLFLHVNMADMSRRRLRRIVELGGVHLDGRRIRKCGLILKEGQQVELHLDGESLEPFRIEPSHVLYQDEYLLALNKPAGVNTQPTPARYKGTDMPLVAVVLV